MFAKKIFLTETSPCLFCCCVYLLCLSWGERVKERDTACEVWGKGGVIHDYDFVFQHIKTNNFVCKNGTGWMGKTC